MRPSEYIREHGSEKSISGLHTILCAYEAENGDDIEQMKAITPKDKMSEATMKAINEYELEVRIGTEALRNWRDDLLIESKNISTLEQS